MAKSFKATPEELAFFQNAISAEPVQATQSESINESLTDNQAFFRDAESVQLPRESVSTLQSVPSAAIKGLLNGFISLGEGFGGLQPDIYQQFQDYANNLESQNVNENRQSFLDEYFPSNSGFLENAAERAGNILPALASGGGSIAGNILRSVLGGASGAIAESQNYPAWLQSLAEIPAQIAPGFKSIISPNANQQKLVQEARSLGLAEKEIAPLIQSPRKQRALSKIAERRGKTETSLKNSYDALGRVYDRLSNSETAKIPLNPFQTERLGVDIEKKLSGMPAEARNKISEDFTDLLNGNVTGESLINFYQDINYYVGRGERQLGLLKEPITTALSQISPELALDFNTTNQLYQNYHSIAKDLKPNIATDLLSASKPLLFLQGVITGNFPLIKGVIGAQAARQISTELLINPRFQNLSKQMVNALNKNQISVGKKIFDSMLEYARDIDPESALYLQKINFADLQKGENGLPTE